MRITVLLEGDLCAAGWAQVEGHLLCRLCTGTGVLGLLIEGLLILPRQHVWAPFLLASREAQCCSAATLRSSY